ncbi:lysis protein [Stutzerimonas stutzeri]|nr:lysis protein [Stutzerimonas stutzeri]
MQLTDLIPTQFRRLAVGLLAACLFCAGWLANGWRLGEQLAKQGRALEEQIAQRDLLHSDTLGEIARASYAQLRTEQDKRLQLEQQLQKSSATRHKESIDAKTAADRLRDRLATTELRLSVLVDSAPGGALCAVPACAAAGGVVHGAARAELDAAHAQRIVGITDDGDQGLIALKACQDYAQKVSAYR